MKKLIALASAAVLSMSLAACGSSDEDAQKAKDAPAKAYDISKIEEVPELAAMVPDVVKSDGKLTIGSNIFYAPAEFYAEDGTPQGYDIDMARAVAKILGLEAEFQTAEFASIIPAIGTKYEAGIANFTINEERMKVVDMIKYLEIGSAWSVPKGNPSNFDPDNPCGARIGVQTGTVQDEAMADINAKCGDNPIQVQKDDAQSKITLALSAGQLDAMYTDSSVADYAVSAHEGKIERIGELEDPAWLGVAVNKDNAELTKAIQAALQYLIDEGKLADVFQFWGITDGLATEVEVNPTL